ELHRVETAVVVHPARATIRELVRKRMRVESANATRRSREVGVLRTAFDAVALARPPVRGLLRGGRVDLLAVEWLLRIFGAAAWLRSTPGARVHE
ncbi:MAG: hypothetical protein OSA99_21445, partial [Acidimicrobiales bacterium]|nr:hypothetical protein [Acidimicrobiales bacterium]